MKRGSPLVKSSSTIITILLGLCPLALLAMNPNGYHMYNFSVFDRTGEIKDVEEVWKKWKGKEASMFLALASKYKDISPLLKHFSVATISLTSSYFLSFPCGPC